MAWLHAQASAVLGGPLLPMALISGTQISQQQPLVVFQTIVTVLTAFRHASALIFRLQKTMESFRVCIHHTF
jgi:hypothetical protein